MPTYTFECTRCDYIFKLYLKINDPRDFNCPNCNYENSVIRQILLTAPALGDPVRMGITKPPAGFRQILKNVQDKVPGAKKQRYTDNITEI